VGYFCGNVKGGGLYGAADNAPSGQRISQKPIRDAKLLISDRTGERNGASPETP
jgi:hypothetical protein